MVVYLGKATPASGSGGGSGTVDQTYDPTSTNAQSGTAVAEALATVTVATDDSTISKNASNELQAIGLKEARTDTAIRLWHGTEEQWEDGVSQTWYNWKSNPSVDENAMPDSNNWGYVEYGNGKLVAVAGLVYTDNVTYSEDDGETWSTSSMPTGHNTRWNAFAFGDGHFVSIGYNSNVAAYSADGNTWNEVTLPATERWFSLGYGNGRFIAVTQLGSATIYSTDGGESWSEGGNNVSFGNTQSSIVYGDGKFIAIGGVNGSSNQTYYTTDGGENWTAGTMSSSQTWMRAAYGNGKFVAVAKGTDTYAYSSDGITWTDGTLPSSANWMSVTFGNGLFVAVADNGKYAYSSDGLTWTEDTFTGTGWNSVTYGNNKYFAITLSTHLAAQITINPNTYYTSEAEPTTESTVYSAPNTASALTITAVGTGTITLSDANTYNYNASGNQTITQSIGELYPNYLCNIDNVGMKIGTTDIANKSAEYTAGSNITISNGVISATDTTYSAFGGATHYVAGSAGLVPAPTTSDVNKYLKGDGTWGTVSGLQNTATGSNSLTILGTAATDTNAVNIGAGSVALSSCTAVGAQASATSFSTCYGSYSNASGSGSLAIGISAACSGQNAIALGYYCNNTENNSLYVNVKGLGQASYKLLGSDGKIPNDRINGATGSFTSQDGKTITVTNGVITSIV